MESVGFIAPDTAAAAREHHDQCAPVARELVREIAIALGIDGEEYKDRVTESVVRTAQDAVFGSLLRVHVGSAAEFDDWCAEPPYDGFGVRLEGSEHVDRRAWHAAPFAEQVAAVTFDAERTAAVSTVRRQAYGRIYRDVLHGDEE